MQRSARLSAMLVLLICLTVVAGYGLAVPALVSVLPGLQGMSPLTALGLAALSVAILADAASFRLARAAAVLALGLGIGLLAIHLATGADTSGPFVAAHLFGYDPAASGRTSPATAACLAMLGLAGLSRHRPSLADGLAFAAMVVSGATLLGYAYGVSDLYALWVFRTMALHTAAALFVLGAASLLVRPDSGTAALVAAAEGGATRRQLAFTLVPVIAGWLLLQAMAAHRLGAGTAMAFLVASIVAPLAYLIVRDGRAQAVIDAGKRATAAALAAAALDLEARLAEQAAALRHEGEERAKTEAVVARAQRMEAVGQLTGGIAHDFNNLLMAIGGNLNFIAKRLPADHPVRRFVDNATVATERGAKLTGQLLAFSRTQRLDIRPVELDPVLARARDLLGNALGPTVDIEMTLGAAGTWVTTDPDQLDLAVINLALNARDAMGGVGRLVIESRRTRTRLQDGAADGNYVSVRLVDEGEGMTPEVVARAVEPFFTTKERGKGTGLGLAQVYGFARQCRGDLRITSAVGQGTTIEILLPCVDAKRPAVPIEEAMPATGSTEAAEGAPRLVLVIDDDDGVRAVMVDALRGAGFEVIEARNGADGLAALDEVSPAAAIIDFIMPGMNGAEVARQAQLRRPGLPIVFVSGYFDTVALDGIAGAVVLRKPFDIDGLQRSVSSVLH